MTPAVPMSIEPLRGRNAVPFVASVPGSKSMTNRALVLAAMRPGITHIDGGLHADDTLRLAAALGAFGGLRVEATTEGFVVERDPGRLRAPSVPLDLGGSGTGARFLLAFAALAEGATTLHGDARLCERPMGDVLATLAAIGIRVDELGAPGRLPVRVHGGVPRSRRWVTAADTSSQFASALLLLASQCEGESIELILTGRPVSQPYLAMTCAMLRESGVAVAADAGRFVVTPAVPQCYRIAVEPDASSLSYFFAAAAVTKTTVEAHGIGAASLQADAGFVRVLQAMGCAATVTSDRIVLRGSLLDGIEVDLAAMPDVMLTLAAIAPFANSPVHIHNIAHLRGKESDRIDAAAHALRALGISCRQSPDALHVEPGPLRSAQIVTRGDHRVAMAFSVTGLVQPGLAVDDAGCVSKSFPHYWRELARFAAHHAMAST